MTLKAYSSLLLVFFSHSYNYYYIIYYTFYEYILQNSNYNFSHLPIASSRISCVYIEHVRVAAAIASARRRARDDAIFKKFGPVCSGFVILAYTF